jgi:plasmid stabilization system protein ParE
MSLPIRYRREARSEFDAAFDWYEAQRQGLGDEFSDEVRAVLDLIRQVPELHPVVYRDIRRAVVKRFPYTVYYRVESSRILVIAVIHNRRDPSVWQSRA